MTDRRYYQRARLQADSSFFIKNNESGLREFEGVIEDISEGGIRFFVAKESITASVSTIKVGSIICFQSYDEYELYNETKGDVFTGEVEVIRIESSAEGLAVGCKLVKSNAELEEYIKNKKVSIFSSVYLNRDRNINEY